MKVILVFLGLFGSAEVVSVHDSMEACKAELKNISVDAVLSGKAVSPVLDSEGSRVIIGIENNFCVEAK